MHDNSPSGCGLSNDHRLDAIESRNHHMNASKAWENSWTRRLSVCACIYIVACCLMWWVQAPQWPFAAMVPPAGYLLSSLSLQPLKTWWVRRYT